MTGEGGVDLDRPIGGVSTEIVTQDAEVTRAIRREDPHTAVDPAQERADLDRTPEREILAEKVDASSSRKA